MNKPTASPFHPKRPLLCTALLAGFCLPLAHAADAEWTPLFDGKKVIDTTIPGAPATGPIVLQHHGGFNEKTKEWNAASALVQFRNLKIRELTGGKEQAEQPKNATPAAQGEWKGLWNGKDFDGFAFHLGTEGADNKDTFTIKDGVIVVSGTPSGYMYTKKSYSDFIVQYDWNFKRPDDLEDDKKFRANSGCLIHIAEGKGIGVWPRCVEVQGMYHQAGLILPIPRNLKCQRTEDKAARTKVLKPVGEWQTTTIDVKGGDMTISLNGAVVSTVSDCELTEGPIGFQSEGKEIHLRNIRILERN